MKKNTLEDYKAGIKAKYEEETLGDYNSFLVQPSRAKLRDLCIMIFSYSNSKNDHQTFRRFFGFEFNTATQRQLKDTADKFRPIETFFKNDTDLSDINAVDIAALLVNFNPRPFAKFLKNDGDFSKEATPEYSIKEQPILIVKEVIKSGTKGKSKLSELPQKSVTVKQISKAVLILVAVFLSGFGIKKYFSPEKQCMQWQKNHYEIVECNTNMQGVAAMNEVKPIIAEELKIKKIEVNPQTPFFQNQKPLVWYCKSNGKMEYFNNGGFHPETGKPLKPVTLYMIKKYIKK